MLSCCYIWTFEQCELLHNSLHILFCQSAVIKENATNTRSADGEWKLTPDKFFKVVRKMLSTKTEDEFTLLKDVSRTVAPFELAHIMISVHTCNQLFNDAES